MEKKELLPQELLKSFTGSKYTPETKKDNEYVELLTFLYNKGLISKEQTQIVLGKYQITNKAIGGILISNGFISQKDYIDSVIEFNPDFIMNEESISDTIDFEVLLNTTTMIQAETKSHLYISTLEKESIVEKQIKPFIKNKELVFKPAKLDVIHNYINKLSRFHLSDESYLDNLIREALRLNVSDIHIYPPVDGSYSTLFRVDGVRSHQKEGQEEEYFQITARIKDRSQLDIAEKRKPQDGAFQVEYRGKYIDLRVATVPSKGNEVIVIRLLDPDRVKPSLDTLGITDVEEWRKGVSRPEGIALICGPTGSGKTTTLQASVREMDRFGKAIYSIEDPVEYEVSYIGQVDVNEQVGLDFKRGVKAFMRADPDIIILGEIRDEDTARNAIKAAQTGHLVIATLHTNSIRGVVARLKDIGISPLEITELLRTVLVQRLIRTFCEDCNGSGCVECNHIGYKGRSVISECAYFNDEEEVKALIEGKISWATMIEDAVLKVRLGVTDADEVIRVFGEEGKRELAKQGIEVSV